MFSNLLNATATISRITYSAGKGSYASVYTSVPCRIEPASEMATQLSDAKWGMAFKIFFDRPTDVLVNDQLTIDSLVYEVRGVKDQFGGALSHKEVLAVKTVKS